MATLTKKRKAADAKFDMNKSHTVAEASKVVKEITTTKFDASVDIAIRLGWQLRSSNNFISSLTLRVPYKENPPSKTAGGKVFALDYGRLMGVPCCCGCMSRSGRINRGLFCAFAFPSANWKDGKHKMLHSPKACRYLSLLPHRPEKILREQRFRHSTVAPRRTNT